MATYEGGMLLVYEYRGRTVLRRSPDGLNGAFPSRSATRGIGAPITRPAVMKNALGNIPFVPYDYECLAGAPPGIYVEGDTAYVFTGLGQNPGRMGCFKGNVNEDASEWERCENNPLFVGADDYGPIEERGRSDERIFRLPHRQFCRCAENWRPLLHDV